MRTTIDLPDQLLKDAKITAVDRGMSLKELLTGIIRDGLDRAKAPTVGQRSPMPPPLPGPGPTTHDMTNQDIFDMLFEDELRA